MIPGFYDPNLPGWPVPRVRAALFLPSVPGVQNPQWFGVDFLIDTGASTSCLHPIDSIRGANIPILTLLQDQHWSQQRDHGGIGGSAVYFPVPAVYAFMQADGQWKVVNGEIEIAQLTLTNTRIPSLLGWDILQQFKLWFDWTGRTIGLE